MVSNIYKNNIYYEILFYIIQDRNQEELGEGHKSKKLHL